MSNEDKAPFPEANDALAGNPELEDPEEPTTDLGFDEDVEGELPPAQVAEVEQIAFANPGDPAEDSRDSEK